ncbi:MAG: segregation/condensation protein A [Methanospirillaceae archaeon]|nr:segregation/condensation protein A [Methanospirillaceae archaeon]
MTTQLLDDPLKILVGLAERGEIDPWNIDILEVCDKFFAELEAQRALDLRISGRALFYAATLLRIKSEYLSNPQIPFTIIEEEDEPLDGEILFASYGLRSKNPMDILENEIKRRLDRKGMRKQPITLYDLITILRNAEKEDRRRQRQSGSRIYDEIYADDIVAIAHEEGFFHQTDTVLEQCHDMFTGMDAILLDTLAETIGWPRSQVYISLLFLMHEGMVDLRQEECYSDLYIEQVPGSFEV